MNIPPRPSVFDRIAATLGNEDPTSEQLKELHREAWINKHQNADSLLEMEKKIFEKERQIHEFQLQDILNFWEISMHNRYFRSCENLTQKMLKFFTPEFDERPDSQQRALKIYSFFQDYNKDDKVTITQEEISLVFRMVNRFGLQGIDAFLNLTGKICHLEEQPDKIIIMIDKCGSFKLIEKLFRINTLHSSTDSICWIVADHVKAFVNYCDHLKKEKQHIDEELNQQIHHNFLNIAKICVKQIAKDLDSSSIQELLNCILQLYKTIPAFDFSFENYYLCPDSIEEKYMEAQDKIAKKLYSTGILSKLKDIFNFEDGWQNNDIIEGINLIIKFVSIEEFETEIVPFLKIYFEKKEAVNKKTYPLSTLLISFIYANEELNKKEEKTQTLVNLLCDSGIFNNIIDTIEGRIDKIMHAQKFGDQFSKKKIETSLNLFYMIVLAFEIIQNCQIHRNVYQQTVELLRNSVQFVKEVLKIEWPGKVLDQLLLNFETELAKRNVNFHPYMIRQWSQI